jgi:hypothetical protein
MTVTSQIFAETVKFTNNFEDEKQPLDGIVGLGSQAISVAQVRSSAFPLPAVSPCVAQVPTLLDMLKSQRQIDNKVHQFAVRCCPSKFTPRGVAAHCRNSRSTCNPTRSRTTAPF